MRGVSYILALIAVLFLVVAAYAWWRIVRKRGEQPPTEKNTNRWNSAAMIIVVGFLFSAVAAIVAVLSWIKR